ncbi:uncharacterized protein JCM6883_005773 [Sporobolomyces salmoneus]|uniref:uncharacterized protein n=1 Tax=Sporobolomyces salmoneus TaxID=183962 RepID=UPI0031728CB7
MERKDGKPQENVKEEGGEGQMTIKSYGKSAVVETRLEKDSEETPKLNLAMQLPTPAATPSFSWEFPFSNLPPLPDPPRATGPWGVVVQIQQRTPPPSAHLPAFPASPSPRKSPSLPLDRLFRAGTLVLKGYRINTPHDLAQDGWISFSKELLSPISKEEENASIGETRPEVDEPSQSPSKGKKRGRTGGRGPTSPSKKKAKIVVDKQLDNLIACSQSLVFKATARASGSDVVLRIYLVPEDLPEMSKINPKERLKRPANSIVRSVLQSIRCEPEECNGVFVDTPSNFMDETDGRSLLEIFHEVETPGEGGFEGLDTSREVKDRLWNALNVQPDEVKTELFPYQRGSIAKMLARELAPATTISPDYLPRTSFLDPSTKLYVSLGGNVALSPPTFKEAKSGILAEDMGVGKTIISLALIMATRSELPSLEGTSSWLDNSLPSPPPVLLTRHSIDFPFAAEQDERLRLRPRVPELLYGADQVMSVLELEEYEKRMERQRQADLAESTRHLPLPSLRTLMINLVKTTYHPLRYHQEDPLLSGGDLFETLQTSAPFYRLYPRQDQLNNSRQGRRGELKPVEIVVAATTLLVVPTDLVRQWTQEIEKHLEPNSLRVLTLRTSKDKFRSPQEMATYDVVLMSVARFTDAAETGDQSLRGVHWKRLLVDEGHVLSSGNLTRKLAEELRTESRWAVSGTPSTNLRGASVDGKLAAASNIVGGTREDLDRLGQLYSRFLRHPAFPRPQSLRQLVGDRPSRLANVFNDSIIRNPTAIVKDRLEIPELTVKVVYVEMEEAERKMYNALTSIFASNAIQSQRVDQDYFFVSRNAGPLKTLCSNLATASTFFASDEIGPRLRDAAVWAQERLESKKATTWSEEDRRGLAKAIEVMKEAYTDLEWNLVVNEVSVAVEVQGLDDELVKAFNGLTSTKNPLKRSLVSLHQLVRLRQDLKELQHVDVKGWNDDEELIEELITFESRRKRFDAEIANRKSKEEEVVSVFKKRPKKDLTPLAPLPSDSSLRNVQFIRTSSAKINYLLDQLRTFPDEKFIIFSSSNVDLLFANISEALDLFGIPHIIFASSHARMGQDRGLKAQRFNSTTAKECQVILVDVEKGGRGVGLTAASRVIMIEPIWRPDLELQATKRAHRLGQTRPVELQILIVKNTYEDALFQRRAQIAPEDFSKKVKVPQQDSSLRTLLQSAVYLEPTSKGKEGAIVSKALLDPPVFLVTEGGHDVSRD